MSAIIGFQTSKIKVVFLDIGGVLLTNGWGHESRKKASKIFGFDYEEMDLLHHFIYNVFEIGSVSLDDYLDTVLFNQSRKFTKADVKQFIYEQSVELPEMLSWLKSWKKTTRLPVFALNNESLEINNYRIAKFKLNEVFDGYFSSCYLRCRKPDPRIYETALKITQVYPQECIYFDDRPMLVDAAKKLGIQGIRHENFENTRYILEK
ncbi:HAD-IA family hydrolase [Gelidibacter salicanalis]|uniref:HAD-IA family hydrolase n=1 Tax=Gelidibacter salicanalis TaxID=291193 RepID=A0A5C7AGB0_9FLAO|nr:HAD-IA family hydrolase [Gelidibacter salicanalis]TXE07800.1 HAD-IA family hydrolase [Gelidibacter salicanalis]